MDKKRQWYKRILFRTCLSVKFIGRKYFMAIYEFLISNFENPGSNRVYKGDIAVIHLQPRAIGMEEMKLFLAVLLESKQTLEQLRQRYTSPLYEDGQTEHEINTWAASAKEQQVGYLYPAKTGKRMFSIPVEKVLVGFPTLNETKMLDTTKNYQPFKKRSELANGLDGKDGRIYADPTTIDVGDKEDITELEKEHFIPMGTKIIYNKFTELYEAI